jgi:hypothetical protein
LRQPGRLRHLPGKDPEIQPKRLFFVGENEEIKDLIFRYIIIGRNMPLFH